MEEVEGAVGKKRGHGREEGMFGQNNSRGRVKERLTNSKAKWNMN